MTDFGAWAAAAADFFAEKRNNAGPGISLLRHKEVSKMTRSYLKKRENGLKILTHSPVPTHGVRLRNPRSERL